MEQDIPILDAAEQRVLGSLIEKSRTTPDYYPMTVNGLTAACNQKTSRNPIVNYSDADVSITLDSLKKKGLTSTATGGSSRAVKYKHNLAVLFPLVPAELAVICMLLLRGPQTPGEIKTNSGRLYDFEDLDEVNNVLTALSDPDCGFLRVLERRAGQKEVRYAHLMGESTQVEINELDDSKGSANSSLESRVTQLEDQLSQLRLEFDSLMKEFGR